ncbi:hypothetical protein G6F35_018998 [Rhizopus arrhizus]|nr:hypothetical protein G6F35_018998 [Rhizopus arrhizus]
MLDCISRNTERFPIKAWPWNSGYYPPGHRNGSSWRSGITRNGAATPACLWNRNCNGSTQCRMPTASRI